MIFEPKYSVLILCTLIALASGSNYAFSAYAPQLGNSLHTSSTELNMIGIAGNLGVYLSGPLWGRILDTRGPRSPLTAATFLQLLGYAALRYIYDHPQAYLTHSVQAQEPMTTRLSCWGLVLAMASMCATGAGSAAGLMSGMSSVARVFPEASRGSASSITIAGYGLSALIFATLLRTACSGRVSTFLAVLALSTSAPMFAGAILLQRDPDKEGSHDEHLYLAVPSGSGPIVETQSETDTAASESQCSNLTSTEYQNHGDRLIIPLDTGGHAHSPGHEDGSPGAAVNHPDIRIPQRRSPTDISGVRLVRSLDFWLIFALLWILSGTGLLYINNIGTMVSALSATDETGKLDPPYVPEMQALQVSAISAGNCIGRLCAGMLGDYIHNSQGVPRVWLLFPISLSMAFSQVLAFKAGRIDQLWKVSSIVGFSYGSVFSLLPMVTLEWFGVKHFASNWGIIAMAPALGGNMANTMFGWIYDAHTESRAHSDPRLECIAGKQCYQRAFAITTGGCFFAAAISVFVALRPKRAPGS